MKTLFLAALALVQPSSSPDVVFQNYPAVHRVDCDNWRGSAFRTGPHEYLSVAHVTIGEGCTIEGEPILRVTESTDKDFTELHTSRAGNGYAIDCKGFIPGHWYWAVGFARGAGFQTAVAIYATYAMADNGERIFIGLHTVIPGMSGGPVIDPETGKVVGLVNMYNPEYNLSFSRELKETSACA